MTYQLPEPALPNCVIGKDSTMRQIRLDCYTAEHTILDTKQDATA